MNLGAPEILVILVVALLVFGPHKLPEIGRQVGGAMRELRKMQDSVKQELQTVMNEDAAALRQAGQRGAAHDPGGAGLDDAGDRGGRLDGRGTGPHRPTGAATSAGGPTRASRGPPAPSASRRRTRWRTRTATQTGR